MTWITVSNLAVIALTVLAVLAFRLLQQTLQQALSNWLFRRHLQRHPYAMAIPATPKPKKNRTRSTLSLSLARTPAKQPSASKTRGDEKDRAGATSVSAVAAKSQSTSSSPSSILYSLLRILFKCIATLLTWLFKSFLGVCYLAARLLSLMVQLPADLMDKALRRCDRSRHSTDAHVPVSPIKSASGTTATVSKSTKATSIETPIAATTTNKPRPRSFPASLPSSHNSSNHHHGLDNDKHSSLTVLTPKPTYSTPPATAAAVAAAAATTNTTGRDATPRTVSFAQTAYGEVTLTHYYYELQAPPSAVQRADKSSDNRPTAAPAAAVAEALQSLPSSAFAPRRNLSASTPRTTRVKTGPVVDLNRNNPPYSSRKRSLENESSATTDTANHKNVGPPEEENESPVLKRRKPTRRQYPRHGRRLLLAAQPPEMAYVKLEPLQPSAAQLERMKRVWQDVQAPRKRVKREASDTPGGADKATTIATTSSGGTADGKPSFVFGNKDATAAVAPATKPGTIGDGGANADGKPSFVFGNRDATRTAAPAPGAAPPGQPAFKFGQQDGASGPAAAPTAPRGQPGFSFGQQDGTAATAPRGPALDGKPSFTSGAQVGALAASAPPASLAASTSTFQVGQTAATTDASVPAPSGVPTASGAAADASFASTTATSVAQSTSQYVQSGAPVDGWATAAASVSQPCSAVGGIKTDANTVAPSLAAGSSGGFPFSAPTGAADHKLPPVTDGTNKFVATPAASSTTTPASGGFGFDTAASPPAASAGSSRAPAPALGFGTTTNATAPFGSAPTTAAPNPFGNNPAPSPGGLSTVASTAHRGTSNPFGGSGASPAPTFGTAAAPAPSNPFGNSPAAPAAPVSTFGQTVPASPGGATFANSAVPPGAGFQIGVQQKPQRFRKPRIYHRRR